MPDYKELYLALFRANEQAIRALIQAQRAAEEALLAAPPPPLHLRPGGNVASAAGKDDPAGPAEAAAANKPLPRNDP